MMKSEARANSAQSRMIDGLSLLYSQRRPAILMIVVVIVLDGVVDDAPKLGIALTFD